LQRGTGNLKYLGRLPLGETLGLQRTILSKQVYAFEAPPALVTIIVALLRILDDCAHSDLLFQAFAVLCVLAKDGEVAVLVATLRSVDARTIWSRQRDQVADAVIKALQTAIN
jgi:hypothetical protein